MCKDTYTTYNGWGGGVLEEEFAKLREHLYVKFVKPCILLNIFLKMLA